MVSALGRLLQDGHPVHPQALLERARRPGRSEGSFARTLEAFLVDRGLAFGLDQATVLAAGRRERRIHAVPEPLRAPVFGFGDYLVRSQQRARRAGTLARADSTIETALAAVRDMSRFLVAQRAKQDWAAVEVGDVEAFLATRGAGRDRALTPLRQFFRWCRKNKVILIDPTVAITRSPRRVFKGRTVNVLERRRMFQRWTTEPDVHPHEALAGLLALLHAATCSDIRNLKLSDIDCATRTIRLQHRRQPVPLDPPTATAIERCRAHHSQLRSANPYLIVTRQTKGRDGPASSAYVTHLLDHVGVPIHRLRVTRIVDLLQSVGPKVVAEALGMDASGLLAYVADDVNDVRLASTTS